MNTPSDSEGIIERLTRPDSPEELASRNVSGPDGNLVQGPPIGTGVPGDASGPDIWGNSSGPLQPPRDTAENRVAPGTMGVPGINGQGAEGGMGTGSQDIGYVSSGGGLGGGNATGAGVTTTTPATGSEGNMSNTGGTTGVTGAGNRPDATDVAQPRDLQPASQAATSTDATMPASIGSGSAGTAIGTDTMGQSRPAGPQAGGVSATGAASGPQSAAGQASATNAPDAADMTQGNAAAGQDETSPGEVVERNVPGGTGPTNAEAGDVGLGSAPGLSNGQ